MGSSMNAFTAVASGVGFLASALVYLRRPLSLFEAHDRLQNCLLRRPEQLLDVFERPGLFRHAGCEYGDIELIVRRNGVESALQLLFREGAYLTIDEFKGRVPLRRGTVERFPLTSELQTARMARS
jgi:hypothetical protein